MDKKKISKPVSNKLDEYGENAQVGRMEEDGVGRVGDWRGGIGNGEGNDRGEESRNC